MNSQRIKKYESFTRMVQMGEGFIKLSSIPRGDENPTFISTRGTPRVERLPQASEDNAPSN